MAVSQIVPTSGTVAGQINALGGTMTWTASAGTLKSQKSFVIDLGGSLPAGTYKITNGLNLVSSPTRLSRLPLLKSSMTSTTHPF
jgi:hypothetical protein